MPASQVKVSTSAQLEKFVTDLAHQRLSAGYERNFDTLNEIASELGLDRVAKKQVIVGGTNGKGTTVAYLQQLLTLQGLNVGTTTSPHLHQYVERIAFNDRKVDVATCYSAMNEIAKRSAGIGLTYFDLTTFCALYLFRCWEVDVAIVEVGLGGRLDCANVVDADVSVLTNIDLDHCDVLGGTIEAIAQEKVRISRPGKPLLLADPKGNDVVENYAQLHDIPLYQINREFGIGRDNSGYLQLEDQRVALSTLGLKHEDGLASITAVQAASLIARVPADNELGTLRLKRPAGRQEFIKARNREWILDIAHNPAGTNYLLHQLFCRGVRACCAIFATQSHKDVVGMLLELIREKQSDSIKVRHVVVTDTQSTHALSINDDVYKAVKGRNRMHFVPELQSALMKIESIALKHEPILVLGSVDLVSRVRTQLVQSNAV